MSTAPYLVPHSQEEIRILYQDEHLLLVRKPDLLLSIPNMPHEACPVGEDETANPEFVAADLISQAEHSPGSGVLITWHEPLIEQVRAALSVQLSQLQRGDLAKQSLEDYAFKLPLAAE